MADFNEPMELPIDGILDLHHFLPSEVPSLVREYISCCLEKNIYSIRIIHGKGTGALRRTVHSVLEKDPRVNSYSLAADSSGWGATVAELSRSSSSE